MLETGENGKQRREKEILGLFISIETEKCNAFDNLAIGGETGEPGG